MLLFPSRLRWYSAALLGTAGVLAVFLFGQEGAPALTPLVVFALLEIFSEHRAVRLSASLSISPAFMVTMASIAVFADTKSLLGPLLVGMASGLRWQWRKRGYRGWIAFNAGSTGIATLAAASCYIALPEAWKSAVPIDLVAATIAAVVATVVVAVIIGFSFVVEGQGLTVREWLGDVAPAIVQSLPFAVVGMLLGRLYLALGPAVMLLIIVPIVIAREMFASYMRVKESHEETVGVLIHALEQKDHYTAGHAGRVANYARYIGEELNFMPARLERLRFAALMHDIGKLVVPNHLLNKPGRLTAEEFAQIRVHEKVSVQMLSHIDFLRPIAGSGHSDNTRFNPDDPDHPIEPYIVMVADAFDAMTSTRAYRKALSQRVAFQELRDKAGIQFHPACVEALIGVIERRGEMHGAGYEQQPEFVDAPVAGLGSAGLGDLMPSEAV
jgi:HD-GYP domain-containing protein (c-di-GMP phosphodiesterase class II)